MIELISARAASASLPISARSASYSFRRSAKAASSGGDCIFAITILRSANACSSERTFIRARWP